MVVRRTIIVVAAPYVASCLILTFPTIQLVPTHIYDFDDMAYVPVGPDFDPETTTDSINAGCSGIKLNHFKPSATSCNTAMPLYEAYQSLCGDKVNIARSGIADKRSSQLRYASGSKTQFKSECR